MSIFLDDFEILRNLDRIGVASLDRLLVPAFREPLGELGMDHNHLFRSFPDHEPSSLDIALGERPSASDPHAVNGHVGILAGQVIAMLRARVEQGHAMPDGGRCDAFVQDVVEASLGDDPDGLPTVHRAMRRAHITADTVLGVILPQAARELGRCWEDDTLSFVEVTMAMARLQSMLRNVCEETDKPLAGSAGSVLMLLPQGEQHTLGALVAAEQLRRNGISVCVTISAVRNEVRDVLRARIFDAVFVSVAVEERLDIVADLVETLKAGPETGPVVLGGAVLSGKQKDGYDRIKAATGADVVTNDLALALEAVGMAAPKRLAAAG